MKCQRIRSARGTVSISFLARGSRIYAYILLLDAIQIYLSGTSRVLSSTTRSLHPPLGSGRPTFLTFCVLSAKSFCNSWSSSTLCCDCSSSSDFLPADIFSSSVTLELRSWMTAIQHAMFCSPGISSQQQRFLTKVIFLIHLLLASNPSIDHYPMVHFPLHIPQL